MITEEEARDLTDRIRAGIDDVWDLVVEAHERNAWKALGYPNWDAYHEAEFGDLKVRPSRLDRPQVVQKLRDAEMSTRAIGTAVGASEGTVRGNLSGAQNYAPDAKTQVTGRDGRT